MKPFLCCLAMLFTGGFAAYSMDSIAIDQMPPRVKDAIKQGFKDSVILSVEKDNGRNDYVYYFVQLKQSGQKKKIEIDENGLVAKVEVMKD